MDRKARVYRLHDAFVVSRPAKSPDLGTDTAIKSRSAKNVWGKSYMTFAVKVARWEGGDIKL